MLFDKTVTNELPISFFCQYAYYNKAHLFYMIAI